MNSTPCERLGRHGPQSSRRGGCDRQIEPAPCLLDVRRGEVDDDVALTEIDPHVRKGALDAHPALADGRLGEADQLEVRRASSALDLDADQVSLQTYEGGGERCREHSWESP